jgi:hypothetical protein
MSAALAFMGRRLDDVLELLAGIVFGWWLANHTAATTWLACLGGLAASIGVYYLLHHRGQGSARSRKGVLRRRRSR